MSRSLRLDGLLTALWLVGLSTPAWALGGADLAPAHRAGRRAAHRRVATHRAGARNRAGRRAARRRVATVTATAAESSA
ncbi:hypothetical protein E4P82_20505 [Candidatus Competibacter phosphatis]|uniref:Uncharacterized protein n=1 Tax=Candidatus Competibacter phosphatis TaxID=221280 RepID=A0ABX1TTT8_9GAMM|nr:hypothetical protein [Candidatus Competibacter phosphatis]NMQ21374.1 hypothetical protein [Candidatus Competibacter phosphatis]